jgi:hypothetical protein
MPRANESSQNKVSRASSLFVSDMKRTSRAGIAGTMAGLLVACSAVLPWSSKDGAPAQAGNRTIAGGGSSTSGGGSGNGTGTGAGSSTAGYGTTDGSGGAPVGFSGPVSSNAALRKVKNILTGLAPTDADLAAATTPNGMNSAALATLIDGWMQTPQFQDKMMTFFENSFQQSSLAILDYEFQLRKRPGAFDLPYGIYSDNALPLLFQNMKESFARTAVSFVSSGRPFTDLLTTNEFMMTTALKSLYMQIEAPYDIHTFNWKFNQGTRPALTDTLDPTSPNYMVFGYAAPTTTAGKKFSGTCAGDATKVSQYPGNTYLFQLLLGAVNRDTASNSPGSTNLGCMEHGTKPYFDPTDFTDWQMVTITKGSALRPYDLPALRASKDMLASALPRVSFFTTPAFMAVWNTNDSNQHRVTANQALLVALGEGFTSAQANFPLPPTTTAVDGEHAVTGSVCFVCHKALDPMRQFWGNAFDYNDQGGTARSTGAAAFGFANVSQTGTTLTDFGTLLQSVTDEQVTGNVISRFALAMTQKLCFFANSAQCEETDPEMRRIALDFQNAKFDFNVLVRELFSSPLVTAAASTATFVQDGVTISITRRDQLCQALSNRLAMPDICQLAVPLVSSPINLLAGALPADAFSRGTQFPVTAPDPNLFYRAASELVCEKVASLVVDATSGTVFPSSSPAASIEDLVSRIMALPPTDPQHAGAVQILTDHFNAAKSSGATATSAMRSTFSAACQSPTSLGLGI